MADEVVYKATYRLAVVNFSGSGKAVTEGAVIPRHGRSQTELRAEVAHHRRLPQVLADVVFPCSVIVDAPIRNELDAILHVVVGDRRVGR
jgi:hypothetical protein